MLLRKTVTGLAIAFSLAACHQPNPAKHDTAAYDVIRDKSYLVRESKPLTNTPATDSVLAKKATFIAYLEKQGFKRHVIQQDSLLFHRENSLEVEMILTPPTDIWDMQTIIVFDPAKNPFFVNLHRDSTQLVHYVESKP
ncbi:hypothetical protein GA0116948_102254 [Chitinophaga costaii]|uniref:Lipoprotein n=1 Tax=Chitinophaga costaii TaxID=1335309 RepID=A0A1C4ARP4_9BACT|nr:hypothetical protein [Chitinophaga costaii]PUZ26718.1 hypothetical protein DCM91_09950 [Chitinophaga costaii]SCB97263.1 hypothetical protein GA0116948_102254 [Chitinophaga costaii]